MEGEITLAGGNGGMRIRILRRDSAKRYILRKDRRSGLPVAVMPARGSMRQLHRFLEGNRSWIESAFAGAGAIAAVPGATISLRGVPHVLGVAPPGTGSGTVAAGDGSPPMLLIRGEGERFPRHVARWMREEAREALTFHVREFTGRLGVTWQRISLRDTVSRWGSCSTSGTLSFSFRIIMAPDECIRYLAAHEVAHLLHMNHSPAFYRVLAQCMPEHDRARRLLQDLGPGIMRMAFR